MVVNEKPAIARDVLKRFRALLFQLDKDGPQGKRWGNREGVAVLASAVGFASYVAMVDPERGKPLLESARAIARKHGWTPPLRPPPKAAPPAAPLLRPPPRSRLRRRPQPAAEATGDADRPCDAGWKEAGRAGPDERRRSGGRSSEGEETRNREQVGTPRPLRRGEKRRETGSR